MTDKPEPKPCPFCGSEKVNGVYIKGQSCCMVCRNCGAEGPMRSNRKAAVAAWNARPVEDNLRGQLERALLQYFADRTGQTFTGTTETALNTAVCIPLEKLMEVKQYLEGGSK